MAVGRYRALFTVFGIRLQDILFRVRNVYIYRGLGLTPENTQRPRRRVRGSLKRRAGGKYRAASVSGGGGTFAMKSETGAGQRVNKEGAS